MRNLISTVFLFIAGFTTLNAQEVGIRFGEMTGNNVFGRVQ